ncbi:Arm DNA-binding domain-containing protein [Streptococcus suis]
MKSDERHAHTILFFGLGGENNRKDKQMIKQYQLKDCSVRYSYIAYVGIDPLTGKEKRVRKRGFKNKKEAKITKSRLLLKVEQDGFFDKPDRITFSEVYKIWLEHYEYLRSRYGKYKRKNG